MRDRQPIIEPIPVVQAVDEYVDAEIRDRDQYTNRTPLDASGVFSLHRLAARVYEMGYDDGTRAEDERNRRQNQRDADAERRARQADEERDAEMQALAAEEAPERVVWPVWDTLTSHGDQPRCVVDWLTLQRHTVALGKRALAAPCVEGHEVSQGSASEEIVEFIHRFTTPHLAVGVARVCMRIDGAWVTGIDHEWCPLPHDPDALTPGSVLR